MLQCARVFASNIPDFVKKNLRLSCRGHKVDYIFEIGKMTNQFVIEIIGDDKLSGKWERRGLRLWLREKICLCLGKCQKCLWNSSSIGGLYRRCCCAVATRNVKNKVDPFLL